MKDNILSTIGICARARKLISGEKLIEECRKGKVDLVIIAKDASENSVKKLTAPCSRLNIEYRMYGTTESLGDACGHGLRAALGITDEGLARSVREKIDAS